jgi:hypothetical protein
VVATAVVQDDADPVVVVVDVRTDFHKITSR